MPRLNSAPRGCWALVAPLACCLLLAACGDDSGDATAPESTSASSGLSVTVAPAEATAGSTVKASVVNDTDREFTYGAAYELEREVGASFEKVDLPDRPVIEIGYVAPPGESGPPVDVELPADLRPGTYRVVIQRDVPDVGDLSGQFEIVGEQ